MNESKIEIFLAKGGQTYGPYTVEEFEEIKASPDFKSYTYIWDGRETNADWKPMELPPVIPIKRKAGPGAPPPDASHPALANSAPSIAAPPVAPILKGYDVPGIEALCHDSHSAISGKLSGVTDAGCELVTTGARSEPAFGATAQVILNLLDPKSGRSMSVPARLSGVLRKDGKWSYQVQWKGCPELILQQLSATG